MRRRELIDGLMDGYFRRGYICWDGNGGVKITSSNQVPDSTIYSIEMMQRYIESHLGIMETYRIREIVEQYITELLGDGDL